MNSRASGKIAEIFILSPHSMVASKNIKTIHFHKTDKDYTLHLIQELSERVPDLKAGEIEDFVLLKYLSDDMKDDEEIVAACVVENPAEFEHASNRLQHDSDYVVNLMMTYDLDLTDYLSEEVLSDKQVVVYLKTQDFKKRFRL